MAILQALAFVMFAGFTVLCASVFYEMWSEGWRTWGLATWFAVLSILLVSVLFFSLLTLAMGYGFVQNFNL